MILLIDNYDSFVYNLFQLVGKFNEDIKVIRNDEMSVEKIFKLNPTHIIISPGPGKPKNAGICEELIKANTTIPLLGVCLGHQSIIEAFGGTIDYAPELMHGKSSVVEVEDVPLFKGVSKNTKVARYHSLIGVEKNFPEVLQIIAKTSKNEIMAVQHKEYPIYGLQFHPESILSDEGETIIKNFLKESRL